MIRLCAYIVASAALAACASQSRPLEPQGAVADMPSGGSLGAASAPTPAVVDEAPLDHAPPPSEAPVPEIAPEANSFGSEPAAPEAQIFEGTGRFIGRTPETRAVLEGDDGTTLNLLDAPIEQAAKTIIGDILGENYVIEEGVTGTITLQTSRPVARDALLPILETVLRAKGLAIVAERGVYRITPLANAPRAGGAPRPPRGADLPGFGVHIAPLAYVAASEMARVLEPIAPQGSILRVDRARNLLVLAGTQYEIQSLLEAIALFDVDWLEGMSIGIFPVESSAPDDMIAELETIFLNEKDGPLDGMIRFIPNNRLNAVMAITPRPQLLQHVGTWLSRLDGAASGGAEQIYVYEVQNASAIELADVLQSVLDRRGSARSGARLRSIVAPNRDAVELRVPAGGDAVTVEPQPPRGSSPSPFATDSAGSQVVSGDQVQIYPYDGRNALVIVATPQDYKSIVAILEKLDVVSNQVLLEATIAEVVLRDELRFGLQWFFEDGDHQFTLSNAANGAVNATFPGFSYLFSRSDMRIALNALSGITDVKIISSPRLMVVDNKTALLQVGDQVPIATQSAVSVIDPDAPIVNSVSFRDTGVILAITPRVSESGMVLLEIEQEVSDVVSTTTSGIDSPTIQQRKISTTVAVQDGQSLALGGLIEDGVTRTGSGVPVVSRIPVLGNLFKSRLDRKERTELLILITPRVIRNMVEAEEVTAEFRRRLDAIAPLEERLK